MQRLTLLMIIVVTTIDFMTQGDFFKNGAFLPGSASYSVEVLGAAALAYVLVVGAGARFQFIRPAYGIVFGIMAITIFSGIAINDVQPGVMIAGIRAYLRAVPWFFVPATYNYSESQIKTQLKLLLAIALGQVPLAIAQRIQTSTSHYNTVAITGDWTTGTFGDAGVLCIFLVSVACVLAALYERGRFALWKFILLFLLVLIPTTLNETKAMVIFLPLSLLPAIMYAAAPAARLRRLGVAIGLLALFGVIFVPIYDALLAGREYAQPLGEFFSKTSNVTAYMATGADVGAVQDVGRGDALMVPLKHLATDPALLMFGYGIGNASDSSLGAAFTGQYAAEYRRFLQTAFSRYELEIGLLGSASVLALYWLMFRDCVVVARRDKGTFGALAAGFTGVVTLMAVGSFYTSIEVFPALGFLFWYFAGLIASTRMRLIDPRQGLGIDLGRRKPGSAPRPNLGAAQHPEYIQ